MSGPALQAGTAAGAVTGVALLAAGLLTGRFDVAVLALPLLAAVAAARRMPLGPSRLTAAVDPDGTGRLRVRLAAELPAGTEVAVLTVRAFDGGPTVVAVTPATAARVDGELPVLHSGPQRVLEAEVRPIAAVATATGETAGADASVALTPAVDPIGVLPVSLAFRRPNGSHEARRLGQGGEFRDLHPFTPGDRLRRIDWRATARVGSGSELIVRRTFETSEASVALVVDGRDDVGPRVATWYRNRAGTRGPGTLDTARAAAASIAAGYLAVGDRVAVLDLAGQGPAVPVGGGRRHLDRIVAALAATGPAGPARPVTREPLLPAAAVVYLFSSLLDEDPFRLARAWAADGRRVVVVDLLPTPRLDGTGRRSRAAHRLLMLERRRRLAGLPAAGVELVRWADPERDVQLQALARRRAR